MLNPTQVLQRLKLRPAWKGKTEIDFRILVYAQIFNPPAGAAPTANSAMMFPDGAAVLGITASAFVPTVAATGQGSRNRQLFLIDFAFVNNDAIVVGGPIMADALLGGGESDIFPAQEIVVGPSQQINCRVANLTTGALTVHVAYHCLVPRSSL